MHSFNQLSTPFVILFDDIPFLEAKENLLLIITLEYLRDTFVYTEFNDDWSSHLVHYCLTARQTKFRACYVYCLSVLNS